MHACIHTYMHAYINTHIHTHTCSFPYRSLHDIEYSPLCCTVGPCCFLFYVFYVSVQSLSRVQLCNPMDCSTPGLPVHHQLLELAQTHVHPAGDAIQPSPFLSSPSPPAFTLFHHQGLFQWVSSLHIYFIYSSAYMLTLRQPIIGLFLTIYQNNTWVSLVPQLPFIFFTALHVARGGCILSPPVELEKRDHNFVRWL